MPSLLKYNKYDSFIASIAKQMEIIPDKIILDFLLIINASKADIITITKIIFELCNKSAINRNHL